MYHQRNKRGFNSKISNEDLSTCMKNSEPGSPGRFLEFCKRPTNAAIISLLAFFLEGLKTPVLFSLIILFYNKKKTPNDNLRLGYNEL